MREVAEEAEAAAEVVQRAPDERLSVEAARALHLRRAVRVQVEHQYTALRSGALVDWDSRLLFMATTGHWCHALSCCFQDE